MKAATLTADRIWYSACNEDTASEIAVLRPQGKRLLCITASGARVFDLLLADPVQILGIDQNPAQTRLAELFVRAWQHLDDDAFVRFIGLEPSESRFDTLDEVLKTTDPATQAFWRGQASAVRSGVLYSGRWESYLTRMQGFASRKRRDLADRLLGAASIDEQYDIWTREWDGPAWRRLLGLLSLRPLWVYVLREPGLQFVPRSFDIAAYVQARLDHAARTQLFRTTPFAWMILKGHYSPHALPPYLQRANYAKLRARLDRLDLRTLSLQEALQAASPGAFDGASLSDYSSYCDRDVQAGVWRDLSRAIAPNGRVVERKFFNKSGLDLPLAHGFARDEALENTLHAADGAFFYSFVAAHKS